ncbi:MAG: hypothetical protein ABI591_07730 [Kofleriaceae bacterium]
MNTLLAILVLVVPAVAHADQCELVDDTVATNAVAAMHGRPKVVEFCEPCGDKAPGAPHTIEHVAKQRGTDGEYSVTLDKREVDLAYEYVQTAPSKYENLALLAGCPTSGVEPSLIVSDASDTGVLIMPSDQPVEVALPPGRDATPVLVPQPTTTIIVQTDHVNLWLILGACLASSGLWALATIMILRRRRSMEAMRPRAIHLIDRRDA